MTPKQAIEKAAAFIKRIAYDKKLFAVGIAILVGVAKEVYDRVTKKGTPELADFLWTTAGALTWLLLYFVVEGIVWVWITWLT